ncbi:hypothetical protein OS175_00425 [Marinicella sp. S1101]|uniref:hypothetical protein n=1 Tax=Marinicella marina TaxID=2996016 RepID=UPI002260F250|nr:hypothetical protein [Marinicella marina]MCX7552327.1 hypothetical protein [Marinicella marina]MDJ1139202.1 hypothetical protein [Marinicella marina]
MRIIYLISLLLSSTLRAEIELLIVGDQTQPIHFVVLPFDYHGDGLSPAVTVENHIIKALSSTGLFSMPLRYEPPQDNDNMLGWQFAGIRYVLQGNLFEERDSMHLTLTINDTLVLKPTISAVILNPKQLEVSSQLFADQIYRSLFYATFTNDEDKQYLNNENATLTRYLNQLVLLFKGVWQNQTGQGSCSVELQQMPGGVPFKTKLMEDCFNGSGLDSEVQSVLDNIGSLPYARYQAVFDKNLSLQFITTD